MKLNRFSILLFAAVLTVTSVACDLSDPAEEQPSTHSPMPTSADIESVRATPVYQKSGETEYLMTVSLQPDSPFRGRLKGLWALSRRQGSPPVLLLDNGLGPDRKKGDGTFTAIVPDGCIDAAAETLSETLPAGKEVDIECTIHFVGPGEDCGDFGQCPYRVHRSALWGLVEYSTDIVVCFCVSECKITW